MKRMIEVDRVIRLRNLMITAIEIVEEKMKDQGRETKNYQYSLGMLHCLQDSKYKLNVLIERE